MTERRSNTGVRVLMLLIIFFNCQFSIVHCQVYPVHAATQLLPPYSVYLADYAAPGCEQLRVILLQRDLTRPAYRTFLRMSIEWNGREIIRSTPSYRPSPLTVSPGVPTIISGSDLYHYLDPRNMDFTGYSRETYLRTKALPEGQYRITFTAYDYARPEVAVSLPGSTFLYLAKADPPLLNMPPDRYIQPALPVQNIVFSWLPRNISSPNSAGSTEYLAELFEIRPAGYNPDEIVKNTRPIFSTRITQTQYMYGMADPALIAGMQYAWRVRAVDTQGRDAIRNNGYSKVFTFTYGDTGNASGSDGTVIGSGTVMPATVEGFKVEAPAPRRAKAAWQASAAADGYILTYRLTTPPTGSQNITPDNEWEELETTKNSLDVNGLIPGATYEARLQSKSGTRRGGYSDPVTFTMPGLQEIRCGDPYTHPQPSREPLEELKPYSEINAGGFPVTVSEATGGNGRFSGRGYAQVPMLGYVKLQVTFSNIFVNSDYYLVDGVINVITDWENSAIANADVITEGGRNTGRANEGVEQTDIVTDYEIADADSIYRDKNGDIIAVDTEGNTHVLIANTNPPQITNDITKNNSKENNNNQNHVAIATEYGFNGSQTIQVGNGNSQNVSEDTKNRILRELVESIKSKININTFSGTDRQYIEGAIINTEFILNSTNFRLERNGTANGWYENGQLYVYTGVETEDDVKSTIFHEYLHHVNYLLQVFPYRYTDEVKRYIYEKRDACFYFGKKSIDEIYEDFMYANAFKIMQENWSGEYLQLKEEQKEEILRYKEEQKDKYERETCMPGKYRPSNYFRDEISIYRIILKLNGILFNLSDSKRNAYLSSLSEYEKTILPRSVAYENRNNINNNGHEK